VLFYTSRAFLYESHLLQLYKHLCRKLRVNYLATYLPYRSRLTAISPYKTHISTFCTCTWLQLCHDSLLASQYKFHALSRSIYPIWLSRFLATSGFSFPSISLCCLHIGRIASQRIYSPSLQRHRHDQQCLSQQRSWLAQNHFRRLHIHTQYQNLRIDSLHHYNRPTPQLVEDLQSLSGCVRSPSLRAV
jgi:hypothetical protein